MPQPSAPQPSAPRKSPGRPPRISREEVIGTARRIVTEEGVDRLTMRRLAAEIGSTPMALYHHVRNKEELLVLLLDDYAARALRRPEPAVDPRERVVAAAAAIHEALAACPWIVEVLTADDLMSASALWFVEQIVDGLVECGLSPEQAVHGYRAIWYYTAGEIVVRATAARRRADDDRTTYREQVFGNLDPAEVPRLAQVADRWTPLTGEDTYLDGLRALVTGLLAAH
ncbi:MULTISPECIES: TetR/AcrR family transcriptional regulator [Streptomyces]|uniref:TetR/AcrR family transcriptional regulator n=1 Tax=Streptomyces TaxID=1883 RepID=UPI00017E7F86|nr:MULTISPECIES: TetR/AcrR family transcriptional regulator [Streptomyces]AKL69491.1 transcriptional regulator [Streptomyces sp. Mg1]EDX21528.1 transcriptional regulator [Streptomyces sp. Mg1]RPK32337.1 Tetracycline repressor protein class A [Streptomyces sp. ADI91-18]WBY23874.1 TetR/AcrR family transcriptional regulator [Streptomyces goshikiensis]WSX95994.1 TetR/AcrR family transcriptional regulator [Streptomyces goshikiensis]